MSVDLPPDEEPCGKPCDVEHACSECVIYWQRMRDEGLWIDGSGWTDRGLKEMLK